MTMEAVAPEGFEARLRREARERKLKFFGQRPAPPTIAAAPVTAPQDDVPPAQPAPVSEPAPLPPAFLSNIDLDTGHHRPSLQSIIRLCARHFGLSTNDMISQRRTVPYVLARQTGMYLAKTMTLRSLAEIGRRFGGRDHTTVLHAIRRIESKQSGDLELTASIDFLRQEIQNAADQAARVIASNLTPTKGVLS